MIRIGARAARILDFLLAHRDLGHGARQDAARAPQIDLEGERVARRTALEHPAQRCVRDQAAVPVVLALDLDRRKGRRQGAARHHVLGADAVGGVVEIDEVSGRHVDRTDAEARLAGVDPIEIDQPLEGRLQRRRIVVAGRLRRARLRQPWPGQARREEAGGAADLGQCGAELPGDGARDVAARSTEVGGQRGGRERRQTGAARRRRGNAPSRQARPLGRQDVGGAVAHPPPARRRADAVPEAPELVDPGLGRVAGDQRRVDRADRDPGDPIGVQLRLGKRLIGAGLVGAERAATLQHQRDRLEGRPAGDLMGLANRFGRAMLVCGHADRLLDASHRPSPRREMTTPSTWRW